MTPVAKASRQGTPHPVLNVARKVTGRETALSLQLSFPGQGLSLQLHPRPDPATNVESLDIGPRIALETVLVRGRDIKRQLLFLRSTRRSIWQ